MTNEHRSHLLRSAEHELRSVTGAPVRLVDPEPLPSPHVLLRCRVERGPWDSVIVKQVTTSRFTSGDERATSHRLLNEWAALEFLRSLPDGGPWPELLAANRKESFVVIGDLGPHRTVEEILLSKERIPAETTLRSLGESLARFHASSYGRTSIFCSRQAEFGASSPQSDSTYDLCRGRDVFEGCFDVLGIRPRSGFWEDLVDLESAVHGHGPWWTLIHADAGPQNFVWTGEEAVLVDFEFATVGNALLDLVSARLGFPHSSDAHTVPPQLVDRLENAYRVVLARVVPQAEDDTIFRHGVIDACAHWALARLGGLFRKLFVDHSDLPGDVGTMQAQAFTVYRRFVDAEEGTGHREPIAATVDLVTETIQKRLRGLAEMPVYPAFAE